MNTKRIITIILIAYVVIATIIYFLPSPDSFEEVTHFKPIYMTGVDCGSILVRDKHHNIVSSIPADGLQGTVITSNLRIQSTTLDGSSEFDAEITDYANLNGSKKDFFNIFSGVRSNNSYKLKASCVKRTLNNPNALIPGQDLIALNNFKQLLNSGYKLSLVRSVLIGNSGFVELSKNRFNELSNDQKNPADSSIQLIEVSESNGSEKKLTYTFSNSIIGYQEDEITIGDIEKAMKSHETLRMFTFGQTQCSAGGKLVDFSITKSDLDMAQCPNGVIIDINVPFVKYHNAALFDCSNLSGYGYYVKFEVLVNNKIISEILPNVHEKIAATLIIDAQSTNPINPDNSMLSFTIVVPKELLSNGLSLEVRIPDVGNNYFSRCPSLNSAPLLRRDATITVKRNG